MHEFLQNSNAASLVLSRRKILFNEKKKCTSVETQYMNTFPKMFFLKVKLNLDGIMNYPTISGSSKLPTLHYLQHQFFFP